MKYVNSMILAAMLLTSAALPALAVDFRTPITNIDGSQATGPDGKPIELTLRTICVNALLSEDTSDKTLDGVTKVKRFTLAHTIQYAEGEYSLNVEEIALIKAQIAKIYGPLIVGQAWQLLDPTVKK